MCDEWKIKYQYFIHSDGWLVLKFENEAAREQVLSGGLYSIFNGPLTLHTMPRCFEFDDKEISTMPVGITLPRLPLDCWNPNASGRIISKVGKPIATDVHVLTSTKGRLSCARV